MPYNVSYDCYTCGHAFTLRFRRKARAPDSYRCPNCGVNNSRKIVGWELAMSHEDRKKLIEYAAGARRRGHGDG